MLCTNLWLRIEQPAATTPVLNHFTRWSQTQTYRFVRAALRKFCNSIHTMCFIAERSRLHKSEVLLKGCWGTYKGCRTALRSVWEPLGKRNICMSVKCEAIQPSTFLQTSSEYSWCIKLRILQRNTGIQFSMNENVQHYLSHFIMQCCIDVYFELNSKNFFHVITVKVTVFMWNVKIVTLENRTARLSEISTYEPPTYLGHCIVTFPQGNVQGFGDLTLLGFFRTRSDVEIMMQCIHSCDSRGGGLSSGLWWRSKHFHEPGP